MKGETIEISRVNAGVATFIIALACALVSGFANGDAKVETERIQAEIDRVSSGGGGRVSISPGDHLIGCLILRGGVELHLEKGARLVGSRNPDDYNVDLSSDGLAGKVTNRWSNAMIRIFNASNVAVTGDPGSEICGRNCFDATGEEGFRGPHAITAYSVTNLVLRGYTVRDAGNFGIYAQDCANVKASEVRVEGGHDGFDFFFCRDVCVEGCRIFSGDDCVAGYGNSRLTVRDCEVNTSCSMFRIGGDDVLVESCCGSSPGKYPHRWSLSDEEKRMERPPEGAGRRNTLSIFTFFTGRKVKTPARNICFRNCRFDGVDRVMHYNLSGNERWQNGLGLSDVTFENFEASNILEPLEAYGVAASLLGMKVRDSRFSFRKPVRAFIRGAYVGALDLDRTAVEGVEGPLLLNWKGDAPAVDVKDVTGLVPVVRTATEPFVCQQI